MIDWKSLPYILPLFLITLIAIPGIMMIGSVLHELLHTQDFETESISWDYTNNSVMYVSGIHIYVGNSTQIDEDSDAVARHFEIYALQGFTMGVLSVVIIVCFAVTSKLIVRKVYD